MPKAIKLIPKIAGVSSNWLYLKYPIREIRKIPIPLHIAYVMPIDISLKVKDIK